MAKSDADIFEIINGKRCLKDGHVFRTRMRAMDSAAQRAKPVRSIDAANGGRMGLHRPGFRIPRDGAGDAAPRTHAVAAEAKLDAAYADYEKTLCASWRNDPPPAGSYPYTAANEGTACTVNGRLGHLGKQGAWLVCVPDKAAAESATSDADPDDFDGDQKECPECAGSGEDDDGGPCQTHRGGGSVPDDYERDEAFVNTQTHHEGLERRRTDSRSIGQMMRDHENKMMAAYDSYDREICEAYRRNST
jgi:hypothetical protein